MQYNNEWWLHHVIGLDEAVNHLFVGRNIYGLPNCGCPTPPDPEIIDASAFAGQKNDQIKSYLNSRYTSFAI